MFLKKKIESSIESCSEKIASAKKAIEAADAIVVGAGAGLSSAAGLHYSGSRFTDNFGDFIDRYKFIDMYSAAFYEHKTPEEFWGYFSRHIYLNRYKTEINETYKNLFDLISQKNYFVLTTNVDHIFQKSGFAKDRLFYTQGDYGLFQCSVPCCDETFDNETIIKKMVDSEMDLKIPKDLLPYCPHCGAPQTTNLRKDDKFVEDKGFYKAYGNYERFIKENSSGKVVFLELGVGYNTPSIIKYPFWQFTYNNEDATFISINLKDCECPREISKRSIIIEGDIEEIIREVKSY